MTMEPTPPHAKLVPFGLTSIAKPGPASKSYQVRLTQRRVHIYASLSLQSTRISCFTICAASDYTVNISDQDKSRQPQFSICLSYVVNTFRHGRKHHAEGADPSTSHYNYSRHVRFTAPAAARIFWVHHLDRADGSWERTVAVAANASPDAARRLSDSRPR